MKQNSLFKRTLILLALAGSMSTAWAEDNGWKPSNEGAMTTIPGSIDLQTGVFTRNRTDKNGIVDGHTDYMDTGGSIKFNISNATAQKYKISLQASKNSGTSTLGLKVYSSGNGSNPESGDLSITVSGTGWDSFADYSVTTQNKLPVGDLTFELTFTGGSNVKNISFAAVTGEVRTLTINKTGKGTVTPSSGAYSLNEEVVLTAYPDWGYDFTGWQDGEGTVLSTDNPYTITMDADKTVTGVFTQRSTTLIVPSDEVLDIAVGTLDRCEFAAQDGYAVSFNNVYNNATATYGLNVSKSTKFKISFDAATNQDNVSLNFNIKNGDASIWSKDIPVTNNGNWHSGYANNSLVSDQIAAGNYTLVITFKSSGVYTANVANLKFEEAATTPVVTLSEDNDYTPEAGFADVKLTRTIAADTWSTIVLPFAISVSDLATALGTTVTVAQFTGAASGALSFKSSAAATDPVTTMNANEPYLIKVASAVSGEKTLQGVNIVASADPKVTKNGITFQGTYTNGNVPADSYVLTSSNTLYKVTDNKAAIKPFRAYFTGSISAGARLTFDVDGETTGIDGATLNDKGEMTNDKVYDLQGRQLSNSKWLNSQLKKGLYIVNGKKVIKK